MDFWDYLADFIILLYKYIFVPWGFDETYAVGTIFLLIGITFIVIFSIAIEITKKTEMKFKFLHYVIYCALMVLIPSLFIYLYWYSAILLSIPVMIIINKTEDDALNKIFSKSKIMGNKINITKKILISTITTVAVIVILHILGCNYLIFPKNISF